MSDASTPGREGRRRESDDIICELENAIHFSVTPSTRFCVALFAPRGFNRAARRHKSASVVDDERREGRKAVFLGNTTVSSIHRSRSDTSVSYLFKSEHANR